MPESNGWQLYSYGFEERKAHLTLLLEESW